MVAPTTPDLPSLLAWAQTVEQRLGQLTNDGSGNAPLAPQRGALVTIASTRSQANINITAPTAGSRIPWDTKVYDTDGIWSAANPTRLTVPGGVTKVRLVGGINLTGLTVGTDYAMVVLDATGATAGAQGTGAFTPFPTVFGAKGALASPVLQVTPGAYFELRVYCSQAAALLNINQTYFAMEILG